MKRLFFKLIIAQLSLTVVTCLTWAQDTAPAKEDLHRAIASRIEADTTSDLMAANMISALSAERAVMDVNDSRVSFYQTNSAFNMKAFASWIHAKPVKSRWSIANRGFTSQTAKVFAGMKYMILSVEDIAFLKENSPQIYDLVRPGSLLLDSSDPRVQKILYQQLARLTAYCKNANSLALKDWQQLEFKQCHASMYQVLDTEQGKKDFFLLQKRLSIRNFGNERQTPTGTLGVRG